MNRPVLKNCLLSVGTIALAGSFLPNECLAQKSGKTEQETKRPNVLFIAIDDMRPILSVYGDTIAHTPNFDRLAGYGVTFMNSYCQMALSGPTRASLLTGLRPDQIGCWSLQGNFRVNNNSVVTIPENFKNNGYETVGIGKVFHPLDNKKYRNDPQSWTTPYIQPAAPTYMLAEGRKATECVDVPDNAYADGLIAEAGVDNIRKMAKSDKPFFLAVGFKKPHAPYVAPKKYWDLYDREKFPLAEFQDMSSDPVLYAYHSSNELKVYSDIPSFQSYEDTKHLDEATQRRVIHAYYACVSYIDAQLGKLLDELEKQSIAENTIIVLWSDHGYHLGDHGLWNKLTNFEGSTRSALMICAPGMKRNVTTTSITEFLDIYPTLCELTGVQGPDYLDGKSLVPILKNPKANVNKYAFGQFHRGNIQGYSCRDNRYRLVEWIKDFRTYIPFDEKNLVGVELYDYDQDPLETRNEANNPKYRKIVEKMQKELHIFYSQQYAISKNYGIAKKFPIGAAPDDDGE